MTKTLLLAALLAVPPLLAAPLAASESDALTNGTYVDVRGNVVPATVAWLGDCNGAGTLRVTLHRDTGDWTFDSPMQSTMPVEACEAVTRCYECPPVPIPFAWTLSGPDGTLVGGGLGYYDTYQIHNVAWTMQGPLLNGALEFRGVLSAAPPQTFNVFHLPRAKRHVVTSARP